MCVCVYCPICTPGALCRGYLYVCHVTWLDVMRRDATWCDVMWLTRDMTWLDVMWCHVMWCDVMGCKCVAKSMSCDTMWWMLCDVEWNANEVNMMMGMSRDIMQHHNLRGNFARHGKTWRDMWRRGRMWYVMGSRNNVTWWRRLVMTISSVM